jgi:hypothetical protein
MSVFSNGKRNEGGLADSGRVMVRRSSSLVIRTLFQPFSIPPDR